MTKTKKVNGTLYVLFIAFILLQPALDIVTSLQTRQGTGMTVGVIIRSLFMMGFSVFVFVFVKNTDRVIWFCKFYLVLASLYCVIMLMTWLIQGGSFAFFENAKATVKAFYLPYMLVVSYLLFRQYQLVVSPLILSITLFQYVFVILLSVITNTSFKSYSWGEAGYNGWFYAANEVGAIICVLSPIVITYFIMSFFGERNKIGFIIFGIATLLVISFVTSFIGTRGPFYGVTAFVIVFVGWNLVSMVRCSQEKRKLCQRQFLAGFAMLICIVAFYFISPLRTNLENKGMKYDLITESSFSEPVDEPENSDASSGTSVAFSPEPQNASESTEHNNYQLLNFILNNRVEFLRPAADEYFEGTIWQKLFGIGYVDIAGKNPNMETAIEMDFIALFLRHGLIGFLIYVIPLIALIGTALVPVFSRFKSVVSSLFYCTMLYSVFIGLGVAFFAGHTLVAPAVSIYFALIFILILVEREALVSTGMDGIEVCSNRKKR